MDKTRQSKCATAVGLAYLVTAAIAAQAASEPHFSPAVFRDQQRSFKEYIRFPAVEGDVNVLVICAARVSDTGRFGRNFCFSRDRSMQLFESAVHRVEPYAWVEPARVNGVRRAVWFQYSVVFQRDSSGETITVYPYHRLMENAGTYGPDFVGAQSYDVKYYWPTECTRKLNLWFSMTVSTEGVPEDVEVIGGEGSERCKIRMKAYVSATLFIPATAKGVPVSSVYVDAYFGGMAVQRYID